MTNDKIVSGTNALLLLFLLSVVFVLPSAYKTLASLAFGAVLAVAVFAEGRMGVLSAERSHAFYFLLIGLLLSIVAIFALSPWSKSVLLADTLFLFIAIFLFKPKGEYCFDCPKIIKNVFYYLALLLITVAVITNLHNSYAVYLGSYDKNYFAVILFLFLCWSWNERRILGIALCLVSAFVIGSRNYLIMIVIFFAVEFWNHRRAKKYARKIEGGKSKGLRFDEKSAKPAYVFLAFFLMLVSIGCFSFWWSSSMVGSSTGAYMSGFNDKSNAIRFNSDKYAFDYLSEHPELVIYGYDSDIIDAMNIVQSSSLNGTESELDGVFYNGYRIVQPHHSILNLLLKEGIVFSVLYFILLSMTLAPFVKRKNASIWLPYLFGCMFMHSLLMTYYLMFLIIVLSQKHCGIGEFAGSASRFFLHERLR